MGNPYEEDYYFDQYRDVGQGEPRAKDVVFDPTCPPALSSEQRRIVDEWFCQYKKFLRTNVHYVRRPAYLEPPFFAFPQIHTVTGVVIGAATIAPLISVEIADRQRAIITSLGFEVDDTASLASGLLWFWLENNGRIVPLFNDAFAPQGGQTTRPPGSLEQPFCLLTNGLQVEIRGPATVNLNAGNDSPGAVVFAAHLGMYQYWVPKADEFQTADYQE